MIETYTVLSKSKWLPSIRREHALTREAIRHNFSVRFVEAASDIRTLRQEPMEWLSGLPGSTEDFDDVHVTRRSNLIPGHKNALARVLDNALLRRVLAPQSPTEPVVTYLPWQWSTSVRSGQRVFDCTDPWPRLYPHRESAIRSQLLQIAREADEIIVVSSELAEYFPNRAVRVIPNGVDEELLTRPPVAPRGDFLMLYLGTLSERIDFDLLSTVLSASPKWSLDMVGPCAFRGFGNDPSPALREFLRRFDGRVTLHAPVSRVEAQRFIDRSDILVAPTLREFSIGQSSMKTFDAAARGREILSTPGLIAGTSSSPAQIFADDANGWIDVLNSYHLEGAAMNEIRSWAEEQTWKVRFRDWISLVVPK